MRIMSRGLRGARAVVLRCANGRCSIAGGADDSEKSRFRRRAANLKRRAWKALTRRLAARVSWLLRAKSNAMLSNLALATSKR